MLPGDWRRSWHRPGCPQLTGTLSQPLSKMPDSPAPMEMAHTQDDIISTDTWALWPAWKKVHQRPGIGNQHGQETRRDG